MKKIKSVKQLIITLIVGFVPTAICFTVGWTLAGLIFLLLTLFALCFSFVPQLYIFVFSLFAIVLLSVVCGALIDQWALVGIGRLSGWRNILSGLGGLLVGSGTVVGFWLIVLYANARWLMDSSKSLDVSTTQMMTFVFSRVFQIGQQVLIVDDSPNGVQVFDTTKGILSSVGGPGILILSPGFAAVLQSGGKITRVVGPGVHGLWKFENFVQPRDTKGIVDLRPQFAGGGEVPAKEVRTQDGIPLEIVIGTFFQIEPTYITDQRPESHYEGGDATSQVIGGPEYPVYEAIIRKSLTKIPRGGFKTGWFPGDPITRLRDVVATYTLDEIFQVIDDAPDRPRAAADRRVIKKIEQEISQQFDPSGGGVWFKGIDIREIRMPEEIEKRMIEEWIEAKQFQSKVAEARANRDAVIIESEGRARALERMEIARFRAWKTASEMMLKLMKALENAGHKKEAWDFVNVIRQLTVWAGQDDTVAMQYIEAIQRVVESEGSKHFVLQPVTFGSSPQLESGNAPSADRARDRGAAAPITTFGGQTQNGQTIIECSDPDDAESSAE